MRFITASSQARCTGHGLWLQADIWGLATTRSIASPAASKPSPFPTKTPARPPTPELRERIAHLAEQIDAHRKRVLAPESGNTGLTLTGIYNVLAALREGRALTAKEKTQHAQVLVGVLRELHDELDAAVLTAYGLRANATTDDILTRLVQLNTQRAAEEAQGRVRWLRPASKIRKIHCKNKSCYRKRIKRQRLIWIAKIRYQNKSNPNPPPNTPGPPRCPNRCAPWPMRWPPAPSRSPCPPSKPASKAVALGRKACPRYCKRWRRWGGRRWCTGKAARLGGGDARWMQPALSSTATRDLLRRRALQRLAGRMNN